MKEQIMIHVTKGNRPPPSAEHDDDKWMDLFPEGSFGDGTRALNHPDIYTAELFPELWTAGRFDPVANRESFYARLAFTALSRSPAGAPDISWSAWLRTERWVLVNTPAEFDQARHPELWTCGRYAPDANAWRYFRRVWSETEGKTKPRDRKASGKAFQQHRAAKSAEREHARLEELRQANVTGARRGRVQELREALDELRAPQIWIEPSAVAPPVVEMRTEVDVGAIAAALETLAANQTKLIEAMKEMATTTSEAIEASGAATAQAVGVAITEAAKSKPTRKIVFDRDPKGNLKGAEIRNAGWRS
ncbi:hypothetical protein ACFL59_05315 [Planctomycetota bacterium]